VLFKESDKVGNVLIAEVIGYLVYLFDVARRYLLASRITYSLISSEPVFPVLFLLLHSVGTETDLTCQQIEILAYDWKHVPPKAPENPQDALARMN